MQCTGILFFCLSPVGMGRIACLNFTHLAHARYNRPFHPFHALMQVLFGEQAGTAGRIAEAQLPCALTIGNFDGVHLGHQAILRDLREEADRRDLPTALLTFEPHPRELFARNNPPARLMTLRDKLDFLASTGLVDRVHVLRFNHGLASLAPEVFIDRILRRLLHARFLLIGDDFRFGARRAGDFSTLAALPDIEVRAMSTVEIGGRRASSSLLRDALGAGQLDTAARLLGRPYQISGRVVHGRQLGRQLGFPTANICLPFKRPALQGVFAVECDTPAGTFMGAASLGRNPTVETGGRYKLEVYLLDFTGDLYGQRVTVRFMAKLRDEAKYDSLDALVSQIHADVAATRRLLAH
ncbi:bifunctional riboflavin kinase/FAD synthetase [Laribacter hongkongensis]|uniref:bifunctional riboflavin kinase/FAD synthetase n=1 Tax=Laribacter hongkongensis TaxID=168471 RepID=UPI0035711FDB